ncbi:hypothetical protein EDB83DRAFT_2312938 [Lactarius deliciosus]|nr:hypothetical protein EDB83DRAFT_2312938 [Lactarius deliciosus]
MDPDATIRCASPSAAAREKYSLYHNDTMPCHCHCGTQPPWLYTPRPQLSPNIIFFNATAQVVATSYQHVLTHVLMTLLTALMAMAYNADTDSSKVHQQGYNGEVVMLMAVSSATTNSGGGSAVTAVGQHSNDEGTGWAVATAGGFSSPNSFLASYTPTFSTYGSHVWVWGLAPSEPEPDLNWTGPLRGFRKNGLWTGLHWTAATLPQRAHRGAPTIIPQTTPRSCSAAWYQDITLFNLEDTEMIRDVGQEGMFCPTPFFCPRTSSKCCLSQSQLRPQQRLLKWSCNDKMERGEFKLERWLWRFHTLLVQQEKQVRQWKLGWTI